MTTIQFLGAAGTVTGSGHLVEHAGMRILLDCGLFQGRKEWRERNWAPLPIPVGTLDAVVLSHAHMDHAGWIPRLYMLGYRGKVYCTPATRDLCAIMLPDSGHLQEEEAAFANRKKYSKHSPALPLYTEADALRCLPRFRVVAHGRDLALGPAVTLRFHRSGHILGAAIVQLELKRPDGSEHTLTFSGDLGRYGMPVIADPEPIRHTDTLLVECTYGDRLHSPENPRDALRREVLALKQNGGALIIPSFAIGRAQDLLYHLRQLQLSGDIPQDIPIFVDSPMACDATPLYLLHREEQDEEMVALVKAGQRPLHPTGLQFIQSVAESKALNDHPGPLIIIAGAGMATGGRVLHHLSHRLPDARNRVLFVGYQAEGTRGRRLLDGEKVVRIFGQEVEVNASVGHVDGFSAHGDYQEVERWLSGLEEPPQHTFCVHGEPAALEAMRLRQAAKGWKVSVPSYLEKVEL